MIKNMSNTTISEKKKALIAQKEKILQEIKYYETRITDFRANTSNDWLEGDDSSESETEFPIKIDNGPTVSQLKHQQITLKTSLQATQELSNLQILQSEVNVMVNDPVLENEPAVNEPGVWHEVTAECRVDLVPFSITFFVHKPNRKFGQPSYRTLRVTPVKTAHEVELSKSVLAHVRTPSDAVEVLRSYAAAYRSRRTTFARLAEKFASSLFMEPMPNGGYILKCADLLEVSWTLQNTWSPIAPFQHRMKFDLEYMDEVHIKTITSLHRQLSDPAIETDERTLLLSKIISTCLEAKGPIQELYESMESEPEMAEQLKKRRTTLDQEPEMPVVKKKKASEVMAPPKSLPKKAKPKGKENIDNNKKPKKAVSDVGVKETKLNEDRSGKEIKDKNEGDAKSEKDRLKNKRSASDVGSKRMKLNEDNEARGDNRAMEKNEVTALTNENDRLKNKRTASEAGGKRMKLKDAAEENRTYVNKPAEERNENTASKSENDRLKNKRTANDVGAKRMKLNEDTEVRIRNETARDKNDNRSSKNGNDRLKNKRSASEGGGKRMKLNEADEVRSLNERKNDKNNAKSSKSDENEKCNNASNKKRVIDTSKDKKTEDDSNPKKKKNVETNHLTDNVTKAIKNTHTDNPNNRNSDNNVIVKKSKKLDIDTNKAPNVNKKNDNKETNKATFIKNYEVKEKIIGSKNVKATDKINKIAKPTNVAVNKKGTVHSDGNTADKNKNTKEKKGLNHKNIANPTKDNVTIEKAVEKNNIAVTKTNLANRTFDKEGNSEKKQAKIVTKDNIKKSTNIVQNKAKIIKSNQGNLKNLNTKHFKPKTSPGNLKKLSNDAKLIGTKQNDDKKISKIPQKATVSKNPLRVSPRKLPSNMKITAQGINKKVTQKTSIPRLLQKPTSGMGKT